MMNFAFWHEILLVVQTGMAHLIDLTFFAMNKDRKYMPTFSHIGLLEKIPNGGGKDLQNLGHLSGVKVEDLQTLGHIFRALTRPYRGRLWLLPN